MTSQQQDLDNAEFSISESFRSKKSRTSVWWGQGEFYLKNKKREATVTDVKFVSDHLLVVAHRAAAKVYLVEYRDGEFSLLDELTLDTAQGSWNPKKRFSAERFFHPDLMSISGNLIYITEYTSRCCVIELCGNKLKYKQTLELNGPPTHGCHAEPGNVLFGSCGDGLVYAFDENSQGVSTLKTGLEKDMRIKTIGKEAPNYHLLGIDKKSGPVAKQGVNVDAWINLYKAAGDSLTLLDSIPFPSTQIDGHAHGGGFHYFSIQNADEDTGHLAVFKVTDDRLQLIEKIPCHLFPHGLDIRNGKLAYASYKRSSIVVIDLDGEAS